MATGLGKIPEIPLGFNALMRYAENESTGVVFNVRSGHWIKIQDKESALTRIAHDLMTLLDPLIGGRLNHQGGEDI
ncbi:hypothetical protein Nepgr_000344 [Nepenthes gracilis]|uniref:Uncharacterized protein n=1 Tax=Nepenthes gracilis TaxID=150966 RepID=A0AAD3RWM5_NEPGR|nr:hypothetical protein Nepgr_000344 [Nepenthes gracilis]